MIIGRLILVFITALSRIFPGIHAPEKVASSSSKQVEAPIPVRPPVKPPVATNPAPDSHSTDLSKVTGIVGYAKELYQRFNGDQCPAWAAALSFFSIISLPSVLLCGLAILGYVIKSPQVAERQVETVVTKLLPGQSQFGRGNKPSATTQATAHGIIEQMNIQKSAEEIRNRRGWTAFIGIALLLWSALQIFVNAATPVKRGVPGKRNA